MKQVARRMECAVLSVAALALFLSTTAAIAAAQSIYRWTDDRGVVHFGNSPPPNRAAEERRMPAPPRVAAPPQGEAPAQDDQAPPAPQEGEPQVILDLDENALVGASVQRFSGRVKNRGKSVARDVAVDILVFDDAGGTECTRGRATVSPEVLAPGATGMYVVDLQSPCFDAGTSAAVRAIWN